MRRVLALRNSKARTTLLGRQRIGPVTLRFENPCVSPAALRHLSFAEPVRSAAKPCKQRISSSHQLRRRNSPSVTACRPIASCIAITSRMHWSSTSRSSRLSCGPSALVGVCGPRYFSRACFNRSGRSRLPTWSARKGAAMERAILIQRREVGGDVFRIACPHVEIVHGGAGPHVLRRDQPEDHVLAGVLQHAGGEAA